MLSCPIPSYPMSSHRTRRTPSHSTVCNHIPSHPIVPHPIPGDSQHIQENKNYYTGPDSNSTRRTIYSLWRNINKLDHCYDVRTRQASRKQQVVGGVCAPRSLEWLPDMFACAYYVAGCLTMVHGSPISLWLPNMALAIFQCAWFPKMEGGPQPRPLPDDKYGS